MHLEARHQCPAAILRARESSQSYGRRIAPFGLGQLTQFGEKLIAVFDWHANITQEHVRSMLPDSGQALSGT